MVEMVITKITAPPMPIAVEVFFETPRNGQIPKNFARTILLMKMVEIIITRYSILGYTQRGGAPAAYDRLIGSQMGAYAVKLLCGNLRNRAVGVNGGGIFDMDLDEAVSV